MTISGTAFGDDDLIHGDTLTYTATQAGGVPLPSWLSFNGSTRTFSGTPGNSDIGLITLRVTATDIAGGSISTDFALEVLDVNDTTTAQAGTNSAIEDGAIVSGQLVATDIDPNSTLTYSMITNTTEGSVTVNANGSYSFNPGSAFQDLSVGETRNVTFVYEVEDNNENSQATVTITVSGTNDGLVAQSGTNTDVEDGTVVYRPTG